MKLSTPQHETEDSIYPINPNLIYNIKLTILWGVGATVIGGLVILSVVLLSLIHPALVLVPIMLPICCAVATLCLFEFEQYKKIKDYEKTDSGYWVKR